MKDEEIAVWMQQFAAIEDRQHALPDPGVIWLKARVLQSAKAVERASRPITTAQIAAYTVIAGCWAALLIWKWNALEAWINAFRPSRLLFAQQGASLSFPFVMAFIALGSVTAMLAMHTIFAEE